MYTYKTYGQMDLQTKYVHVQNLWSNEPSKTKYTHVQNLWSNGPSNQMWTMVG